MVTTAEAVRFRMTAHGLDVRRPAETPLAEVVRIALADYPKGAAARALAARRAGIDADTLTTALADEELVRTPSLRGTTHVLAAGDLDVFTLGALPAPGDEDATRAALGSAWPVLEELGVGAAAALDRVRDEILDVVADRRARTKGEISEGLHGRLPEEWEPWCGRCRAHHVPDLLFRLAANAAGLRFADGDGQLVPGRRPDPGGHGAARRELIRRFLGAYAPTTAQAFAEWCGVGLGDAKASFAALGDELVEVRLDRRSAQALADDVDRLLDPTPVEGVRLVPAGDPFLHQRDRATLVGDPTHRRALWRPAGTPGLVLLDGQPAGTWRHKQAPTRSQLLVTVDPWLPDVAHHLPALEAEATLQAATHGSADARVEIAAGP